MTSRASLKVLRRQLKDLIRDSGQRQSDVAEKLHMTVNNLNKILNGRSGLTLDLAERIAWACDASIELVVRK